MAFSQISCGGKSSGNSTATPTAENTPPSVDNTAPSVVFTSQTSSVVSSTSTRIELTATDNVGVTGGPTAECTNGGVISESFFIAPTVSTRTTVECTATAQDAAENIGSKTLTFAIIPPAGSGAIAKNIVMIMLDDADFSDFGFNNELLSAPDAITPNMDELRSKGKLLRNFYAGSGVCTPSRVSLLTGKTPVAFGAVAPWPSSTLNSAQRSGNSNGLPLNIPQLGLLMQEMGKVTGHYGKWHVGTSREKYRHAALGFDQFAIYRPVDARGWSGLFEFETESSTFRKDIDYIDYEFGEMVEDFIIENANSPDGFFVNFWPLTPHFPWSPPESFDNSKTNFNLGTDRGKLLAMMYSVDKKIGDIVQALKDTGQYNDTLILLTSDNGGASNVRNASPYLLGTKSSVLEGGLKVSMVAHWPKEIPLNSANQSVMSMYDLMPTLLDVAGQSDVASLYPQIDGRSKRQALFDDDIIAHNPILSEIHVESNFRTTNEFEEKTYSILKDRIRLVKFTNKDRRTSSTAYALYDLNSDPTGNTNIRTTSPALVQSLAAELEILRKAASRIPYIPKNLDNRMTFNSDSRFDDPRLDVTNKDFTFEFEFDVPSTLANEEILFQKEGTSTLSLKSDLSLKWEITGINESSSPITEILTTRPLTPGKHKINLGINGYRRDKPRIRLYVDGVVNADADLQSGFQTQLFSLLRNISPLHIGSPNIPMENIEYYQLKIYPGE